MRFARWLLWSTLIISCASTAREPALSADYETVFAGLAMGCIHQEYSNKIAHYMNDEGDLKPPRELYPAFYGRVRGMHEFSTNRAAVCVF